MNLSNFNNSSLFSFSLSYIPNHTLPRLWRECLSSSRRRHDKEQGSEDICGDAMLDGPWGHGAGGRLILYRASFSPRFLSVIPQNSAIKGRLELFVHLILLQSTGPRLWLQSRHLEFRDNSYWTGHWSCTISQIPTHEGNCVCTYWYSLHLLRYRLSRDMRRSVLLATAVRLIKF